MGGRGSRRAATMPPTIDGTLADGEWNEAVVIVDDSEAWRDDCFEVLLAPDVGKPGYTNRVTAVDRAIVTNDLTFEPAGRLWDWEWQTAGLCAKGPAPNQPPSGVCPLASTTRCLSAPKST